MKQILKHHHFYSTSTQGECALEFLSQVIFRMTQQIGQGKKYAVCSNFVVVMPYCPSHNLKLTNNISVLLQADGIILHASILLSLAHYFSKGSSSRVYTCTQTRYEEVEQTALSLFLLSLLGQTAWQPEEFLLCVLISESAENKDLQSQSRLTPCTLQFNAVFQHCGG